MDVNGPTAVLASVSKINQVDYQKLNEAISSLNATVTPLAEMMKALPFGSRN